jgi:hypothetical protein
VIRLAPALAASLLILVANIALAQQGPFKIVVLAGEDSVNVIQQKTAVAPLIEVRDRNNVPVPGAMVTFAMQGGKAAAFQGGASSLTIATNAAGQAAATGLTPLSAGAVNISVQATVQGQVVSATISQINVLTAAEAAVAAGGAGAGGGAGSGAGTGAGGGAAGGGGLSATTLGIVGGVAAAGAVVGTQVAGGGVGFSGTFAVRVTSSLGPSPGVIVCTREEIYGGTLEVELDGGDAVSGEARIKDAYQEAIGSTCGAARPNTNWGMPDAPVRGSASALAFEASDTVPAGDGSGPINRVYKFNGSLAGDTITGTFELSWVHQVQGFRFAGTQQITLRKQ